MMSSVIVDETAIIVLILTAPIRESMVRTLRLAEERTMRPSYPQSTSTSNTMTLTMLSERTMKGVIERGDDVDEVVRNGTLRMLTARKDRLNRRLERLGVDGVLDGVVLDEVVLDEDGDHSIERESGIAGDAIPENAAPESAIPENAIPENATPENATPDNTTPENDDTPEDLPVERRSLPAEKPPKKDATPQPMPQPPKQSSSTPEKEATPKKPMPQPPIPMKSLEAISEGEEEPIETNIPGLPDGMALQPVSEREATATLKKGHVRDTLKRIVEQYGTMRGETLQAERFRLVVRDKEKEKQWKPSASVIVMEEEETKSKLKMKRMIRRLVEDDQNDERRQVDWVAFRFHGCSGFHARRNAFARVVRAPECVDRLVRWKRGRQVSNRNDRRRLRTDHRRSCGDASLCVEGVEVQGKQGGRGSDTKVLVRVLCNGYEWLGDLKGRGCAASNPPARGRCVCEVAEADSLPVLWL